MSGRFRGERTGRWLQVAGAIMVLAAALAGFAARGRPASAASGPTATVTPNTGLTDPTPPLVAGELVAVVASGFDPDTRLDVVECEGTLAAPPPDDSSCDGLTLNTGNVTDGTGAASFNYKVFELPDAAGVQTQGVACDSVNPCVIFIGEADNDFTQPHVFEAITFATAATTTTTSTPASTTTTVAQATTTSAPATTTTTTATGSTTTTAPSSTTTSTVAPLGSASAPVGSQVTLTGSGFTAATTITFTLDTGVLLGTAASAADGSFSFTFLVPTTLTLGPHVVTATGVNGQTATFDLTVLASSSSCAAATTTTSTTTAATTTSSASSTSTTSSTTVPATTSTTACPVTSTTAAASGDGGTGLPFTGGPLGTSALALAGLVAIVAGTDLRRKALRKS